MSALIIVIGAIILFVIYFIGKGFLTILDYTLDLLTTLMGCGWFWIVTGIIFFVFIIRCFMA